jgi:hypothetical protein
VPEVKVKRLGTGGSRTNERSSRVPENERSDDMRHSLAPENRCHWGSEGKYVLPGFS